MTPRVASAEWPPPAPAENADTDPNSAVPSDSSASESTVPAAPTGDDASADPSASGSDEATSDSTLDPGMDPAAAPEPEAESPSEDDSNAEAEVEIGGTGSVGKAVIGDPDGDEPGDPPLPPKHRLTYFNLIAARYNPLGLEERLWIGYQYRLYDDKTSALWNQSNIAIFANGILSPAMARVGPTLQIQPLTILRLRATYGFVGWFGTFQYMRSYDSPYADHSESQLKTDQRRERNYATFGQQLELGALFQIKAGPIALRNDLNAFYNAMRLTATNDVFYDVRIDALVPNNGWTIVNDTDLLYVGDSGFVGGVRNTVTKAFFPKDVYEVGEEIEDPNGPMVRLGPVLGFTFFDKPEKKFNKPTLLLITQWHLKHRYRTGLDRNQGIPTLALAFAFSGDLWKKDDEKK